MKTINQIINESKYSPKNVAQELADVITHFETNSELEKFTEEFANELIKITDHIVANSRFCDHTNDLYYFMSVLKEKTKDLKRQ